MIPAMTELMGPKQHLYQAAALIVNFFVATPAVIQHLRAKAVQRRVVMFLAPVAAAGSLLGVLCSEFNVFRAERSIYLTGLFGLFLFCIAGREIARLISSPKTEGKLDPEDSANSDGTKRSGLRAALAVGVPTGFVSGLLGVGGGTLAVPLQRRFLDVGLRSAIANSAAMIVVLSLVGATAKHIALAANHPEIALHQPIRLAAYLIPTAIAGAWAGGRLTHVLPLRVVRSAFAVLLVVAGIRMVIRVLASADQTLSLS